MSDYEKPGETIRRANEILQRGLNPIETSVIQLQWTKSGAQLEEVKVEVYVDYYHILTLDPQEAPAVVERFRIMAANAPTTDLIEVRFKSVEYVVQVRHFNEPTSLCFLTFTVTPRGLLEKQAKSLSA